MLFLKSEQEFDSIYQYGIIRSMQRGRDDKIRIIEVEYENLLEVLGK